MKYIVVPNNINDLSIYKDKNIDTFIIGLENYSINYPTATIDEIKKLSKEYNLFVAVNKNIFNSELNDVLDKLKELSKLNILGVLYYDLGILNLVIDNKINIDLVWHQTHMVTNYNTCNYYLSKGVKYAYVANEITLDEIVEIKNKSDIKLLVNVFGYPIASHSRRLLLTNYFKSINKEKENRTYNLTDRTGKLLIKESIDGASILSGYITNGTKPLFTLIENNIDYLVLDTQGINKDICFKVIDKFNYIKDNFNTISDSEKEEIISYMNNLIGDSTNFFYKKTIYKVKRGDK